MTPSPNPILVDEKALLEVRAAASQAWERTVATTDFEMMVRLWRSIEPADKSLALEMADADRRRAQTMVTK